MTLRIDPELKKRAQTKAEAEDLTLSQAVRRLLKEWLRDDPPEQEDQLEQD